MGRGVRYTIGLGFNILWEWVNIPLQLYLTHHLIQEGVLYSMDKWGGGNSKGWWFKKLCMGRFNIEGANFP